MGLEGLINDWGLERLLTLELYFLRRCNRVFHLRSIVLPVRMRSRLLKGEGHEYDLLTFSVYLLS